MNFPPLKIVVDTSQATLYVAGLKTATLPVDENIHEKALDKAFEIVRLHNKDLPLTIEDNGSIYHMVLTKNGETIDQTQNDKTSIAERKSKIIKTASITLATLLIAVGSAYAVKTLQTTSSEVKEVNALKEVKEATEVNEVKKQKVRKPTGETEHFLTSLRNSQNLVKAKEKAEAEAKAKKETEAEAKAKLEKDAEEKARAQAQTPATTPPAPLAPPPPPAPLAPPVEEGYITGISTSVTSGKGTAYFTVSLEGGQAPVTAEIAGKTLTFSGTGTISGIPKGTYTWTTSVDGLSNTGVITIP